MQKAVLEAEAACVIPGSSREFQLPLSAVTGLGFSELPELIFGFIFMFLVFLIYSYLSGTVFVVFCMCGPVWTTCFRCFCVPVCQCLDVCAY